MPSHVAVGQFDGPASPSGDLVMDDRLSSSSSVVSDILTHQGSPLMALLATSADPGFDVEALSPHTNAQPLLCVVMYYCTSFNVIHTLGLDTTAFTRYIGTVESGYRALPYHSNLHAADVVVNAMRLMKHSKRPVTLTPHELLAAIVASAGKRVVMCVWR